MHRLSQLKSALAVAGVVVVALTSAAPASAHSTQATFESAACGGWSLFPARCGIATVNADHSRITVADTLNDGHSIFTDWVMTSGVPRSMFDPDDSGPSFGAWMVPTPSLDRISRYRLCVTKMNPFTGAPACSAWVAA